MAAQTNRAIAVALGALGALAAGAAYARRHPSACPYSQRWTLELPKPGAGRARVLELLDPQPRERILELGPGTGYYTLDVARRLGDRGRLEVFDLQRAMLDHTMRRAEAAGLGNVTAWEGDAQSLLFEPDRFDGAFLVTVLGEIPDQDAALRELRRVVKPGGRVVFGEVAFDPHMVTLRSLRERAERAGLRFERKTGTPLGYVARFAVPGAA
jgi:ubiquinone/menaquinone biosynthesis C-methylase UbiE